MWRTAAVARLGIPSIQVSDGPSGVRGDDDNLEVNSVCLPAGVALGATWNPELVAAAGGVLAREARDRGIQVLLAPTVNIHRSPLAGRNFECYAEDPYLSGSIAAGYISGLQQGGVAACIKHFVANDQEYERFSMSSEVAERPLREIYLEPFRIALERANPWTVMSAYNRINGTYASEHELLLGELLKGEWGYDGLVMSDWYGTYSDAVPAGPLDLEMPGPARWMDPEKILAALKRGEIQEEVIDAKARRLLRLIDRVSGQPAGGAATDHESAAGDTVPRQAATESIVLLKNQGDLLPLAAQGPRRIVVIGENAERAQIAGGGSAFVNPRYTVSPLEGIRSRVAENVTVEYHIGEAIHRTPPLIDPAWLSSAEGRQGLDLRYYPNRELAGEPSHTAVVERSELLWFGMVNPYIDPLNFSLELSGTITVPESGEYMFHLGALGQVRLELGGETLIDAWESPAYSEETATLRLEAGEPLPIRLVYATDPESTWRGVRLGCVEKLPYDPFEAAVKAAASADVAVVVAGFTREWESEGFDRPDMRLVGRQDELIARVAEANPRTVLVLNTGAPVDMPWIEAVPAVLQAWYGGQDAGAALADILFGEESPSGKLPMTIPRRLEDTPAYLTYPGENGKVYYGEQLFVGYRYYDRRRLDPLFAFGHGLSYTRFEYDNMRLNGESFGPGDSIEVSVDIRNTGSRPGKEVVQLYVRDPESRLVRPERELKAFAKVALQARAGETVTLTLDARSLAYYDSAAGRWVTEPGEFLLEVGSSSRDLRLSAGITWHDPEYVAPTEGGDVRQHSTVAT